jgi:hypothetical protein
MFQVQFFISHPLQNILAGNSIVSKNITNQQIVKKSTILSLAIAMEEFDNGCTLPGQSSEATGKHSYVISIVPPC